MLLNLNGMGIKERASPCTKRIQLLTELVLMLIYCIKKTCIHMTTPIRSFSEFIFQIE